MEGEAETKRYVSGLDDETLDPVEELADSLWVTDPEEVWPILEDLMGSLRQLLAHDPPDMLPFGYTPFLMFLCEDLDPPSKAGYFRARTPEERTALLSFLRELLDSSEEAVVDWFSLGAGIERLSDPWWPGTVNEVGFLNLEGLSDSVLTRIGTSKDGALTLAFRKAGWETRKLLRVDSYCGPQMWSEGVTVPMDVKRVRQMPLPVPWLYPDHRRYEEFVISDVFEWALVIDCPPRRPLVVVAKGDPLWGACTSSEPTDTEIQETSG